MSAHPLTADDLLPFSMVLEVSPKPKKRPRRGRGGHFYTPPETRAAEEEAGHLMRLAASAAGLRGVTGLVAGPVALEVAFWVPPDGERRGQNRRADLDNYVKLLTDSANGVLWHDDRQVVELVARFVFTHEPERIELTISRPL